MKARQRFYAWGQRDAMTHRPRRAMPKNTFAYWAYLAGFSDGVQHLRVESAKIAAKRA